jgi:sugar phosphate isomerase/epimerase
MDALKIGIQLASLRLPLKQALTAARRLGAGAVEIDARGEVRPQDLSESGLRQLRKMLDDLELQVAAVGFHTRRGYNVAEGLEARVAATRQVLEFAYRLKAPVVVNYLGRVPPEPTGEEWQLMLDVLTDLGRHGQHVGATLAAATGSESPADLARLVRALPLGSIGIDLNPGNLVVNGFAPLEAVEVLGTNILHVHATDGVRDRARGRGSEVPLGRGSAEVPAVIGALQARGYRGWYTIERMGSVDPVQEAAHAAAFLRSL